MTIVTVATSTCVTRARLSLRVLVGCAALLVATVGASAPLDASMPNDPLFEQQWHLENTGQGGGVAAADVGARAAWRYTIGSPDVVIAVLDDGIDLEHPDLAPNITAAGRDFTIEPPGPSAAPQETRDRHGTAVAGVAAARGGNGIGVTGICPHCSILPIRVDPSSNPGTAAAFLYAVEHGADIIISSWGYARTAGGTDAVRDAIDVAAVAGRNGHGALVIFGVTNDVVDNCTGTGADIASLESVLAVGVSDHADRVGFSGYGPCIDIVAPAKPEQRSTAGVVTTDRVGVAGYTESDYHATFGGTSAAAPLVAGIAGLLLSLNPDLARAELQGILEHTAVKIDPKRARYDERGFSSIAGYGRVDAARAVVPNVTIAVAPAEVHIGEEFSVTVWASAPFGVEAVSWYGIETGIEALDREHRRDADGRPVAALVWTGLAIDRPGRYTLTADARDARYATPLPGYPHTAGAAGAAGTVEILVREHPDALPR